MLPDRTRGRWLPWLGLAGLGVRLLLLPLPGTLDVTVWKMWAFNAATTPVALLYGVGGDPPERAALRYDGRTTTVDYPPVALHVLGWVGRGYRTIDPAFRNTPRLTVAVKLPAVLADMALVAWLFAWWRSRGGAHAAWHLLPLWWSPAVLVDGALLGYLDPLCALPAVGSLIVASRGAWFWAGALAAVAALTKVQAVIPLLALAAWAVAAGWRAAGTLTAGAALVTGIVLAPIVEAGAWPNFVNAIGSLTRHDMVSGNATNLWWIYTWIFRALYDLDLGVWGAFTQPIRILALSTVQDLGHTSPKPLATGLVVAALGWAIARTWRGLRRDATPAGDASSSRLAQAAALGAFLVHAYFTLAVPVHENHLYLAIPLATLAGLTIVHWRPLAAALGAVQAVNLLLFYGLGEWTGWAPPRGATLIDATVLLAFLNLLLFAWHVVLFARLTRFTSPSVTPRAS